MKKSQRRLSEEDLALWKRVADTTNRLESSTAISFAHEIGFDRTKNTQTSPVAPTIAPFRIGERTSQKPQAPKTSKSSLVMDAKTFAKIKSGKARPEAKIDLHGMTVDEARMAVTDFLLRARNDEKRLVLVVTGKGREISDGSSFSRWAGVLRRHLPEWVQLPPLRSVVLQCTQAHQRHGGGGAFYVYLRR